MVIFLEFLNFVIRVFFVIYLIVVLSTCFILYKKQTESLAPVHLIEDWQINRSSLRRFALGLCKEFAVTLTLTSTSQFICAFPPSAKGLSSNNDTAVNRCVFRVLKRAWWGEDEALAQLSALWFSAGLLIFRSRSFSLSPSLSSLGRSLVPGLPVRFRWVLSQQSVLFSSLVSSFLSCALYSKCWDVSWGLRTRKILLQARRREKKSEPVLLDTSEIKSIWLAPEQHSFSKTAELTTWNVAALKCNVLSSWLSRFLCGRHNSSSGSEIRASVCSSSISEEFISNLTLVRMNI